MTNITTLERTGRRKRNDETSHYVDVEGVRVRYMEEGSEHGGIPLLIVHGYNGSCDYWYPHTVPALGLERWVIAAGPPRQWTIRQVARAYVGELCGISY